MSGRLLGRGLLSAVFLLILCRAGAATPWVPSGPNGGDAREIVGDPHDHQHLYVGTTDGWLYQSHDMGATWERVSRLGNRNDLVLDSIILDPRDAKHIVIGAWVLGTPNGGVYVSHDAGATWTSEPQMQGQSVRALAASLSNPDELVAGTLQGVFRSLDDGRNWTQISPKGSTELHEFESIAIDPVNPDVIYAGTWHLPWKTTDGGKTWANIKQGLIDDSDVFSIIVDPKQPQTVYASACSGIYKSVNAGDSFKKVQGIPSTARRTRILLQDPTHPEIVFAGTTEGLFRTTDAGDKWTRTTGPELIVNGVWISPDDSKKMLITTDRSGILASNDGGDTFQPANAGFSERQVTSLLRDQSQPNRLYAGVVNDKQFGGVFESEDGGTGWHQIADGLNGRDVFSLGQAPDGTLVAGTSHGLYLRDASSGRWTHVAETVRPAPEPAEAEETKPAEAPVSSKKLTPKERRLRLAAERREREKKSKAEAARRAAAKAVKTFDGPVYAIAATGKDVLALTSLGLLTSADAGHEWILSRAPGSDGWHFVAANGEHAIAASDSSAFLSSDDGASWTQLTLPQTMNQIAGVAVQPTGEIWLAGPAGEFVSSDQGTTWTRPKDFYTTSVANLFYDQYYNRMYITTHGEDSMILTMQFPRKSVQYTKSGWNLRFARQVPGHLVGATIFDGVVVQPGASGASSASSHPTPSQQ